MSSTRSAGGSWEGAQAAAHEKVAAIATARCRPPIGTSIAGGQVERVAPVKIAHRGASAYAPEHTLPAYRLALEMGADCVEQDLQFTRERRAGLSPRYDPRADDRRRGAVSGIARPAIESAGRPRLPSRRALNTSGARGLHNRSFTQPRPLMGAARKSALDRNSAFATAAFGPV